MAEQNKEKASVSMEAQLEKISATIESLSKEVANLSASLRQEKEKIKVEVESSLHALNVVMKANQFHQSRSSFQKHLVN